MGGAEHTARGEGGRGARGHTRGSSGRERERARDQQEGGGSLAGGGMGEPPSSRSRPERETPETAADWLTMAQVVGARETERPLFSSPPLQRFRPPHFPPPAAVISRARAHYAAVVAERETGSARREYGGGGAKLGARARLTVVVLRLSLQLFVSSRLPSSPSPFQRFIYNLTLGRGFPKMASKVYRDSL